MAIYSVKSGSMSFAAAQTKSFVLLNPVTNPIKVVTLSVSFDSAVAQPGFAVELYRVTTLGSAAGTAGTQVKVSGIGDAITPTTTSLIALGTEPTATEVLADWWIQPFGGLIDKDLPLDREAFAAGAGQRIGIRCSTPAGSTTCNGRGYLWFIEGA
jgi:hypothetical protein